MRISGEKLYKILLWFLLYILGACIAVAVAAVAYILYLDAQLQ